MNFLGKMLGKEDIEGLCIPETPVMARSAATLPPVEIWPHRPVIVTENTAVDGGKIQWEEGDKGKEGDKEGDKEKEKVAAPIGVPFNFESSLFVGKMLIRLKDVKDDNEEGTESYFADRHRKFQVIVQGKFKRNLPVNDVVTGHEFTHSLKRLPPKFILEAAEKLICLLAPSTKIELGMTCPRALSILGATSQSVSIDLEGEEPNIESRDIYENNMLFGGPVFMKSKDGLPEKKRKKILSNMRENSLFEFSTHYVYTFDFFQHLLDVKDYSLNVGITTVSLAPSLDGQPIQLLAKVGSTNEYLWNFQLWHEDLLNDANEREETERGVVEVVGKV